MRIRKQTKYFAINNNSGYQIVKNISPVTHEKYYELTYIGFNNLRQFFISCYCFVTKDKGLVRAYAYALQKESIENGEETSIHSDQGTIDALIRKHKTG